MLLTSDRSRPNAMPTAQDFVLGLLQATVFTPGAEISANRILSRLLPDWARLFDGAPIALPMPDAMPREIPRVIFQSRSGEWRCECASARLNVFWRQPSDGASVDDQTPQRAYGIILPLIRQYLDVADARVGRLAALTSRYAEHDSPSTYLARHFCKEKWIVAPFNRPENFELHAHKKFLLAGRFQVNSWVRNKTGTVTVNGVTRTVILVEQDLNTLAEEESARTFSGDEIAAFFEATVDGFRDALSLYYPGKEVIA